ncbi:MAG: carbohydrate binding family 9 domain-containing protein [Acidimicrobiia bacterium]|nr:carbohydrate binding family 9 domain-containing protein [Acidimicrobiia bacterium]
MTAVCHPVIARVHRGLRADHAPLDRRAVGTFRTLLLLVAVWLLPPDAAAQGVPDGQIRKQATAVRVAAGAIRLDGRLDDRAWQEAPPITDFVQKEPIEGAPPTEAMEIRFVYDDRALYIGARMYSRNPGAIQAPMGRRDNVAAQSESIIVSLDTFLDRRTAYSFGVSASGVRLDRFHRQDDEASFEEGFDPVSEARSRIDDQGWTAELWIPFSQLRFNDRPEQVWGLNVRRFTPHLEEEDYWVLVPRTERAWASRFGDLRGIAGVEPSRRVELLPFVAGSSTADGRADAADPFNRGNRPAGRAGLDMKMGLGPNLTLQGTVNPDFGQVEADPAEVNLTAVPTRFVEKRPFFVDDSELLNIAHPNFVYSRRIGARPSGPASADFVDYPSGTTIQAAAKLTGRIRQRTSIGLLAAVTGEETARLASRGTDRFETVRVAVPATYGLARIQQEVGRSGSTASVLVAAVHRALTPGDPLAAWLTRDTVTVAGDALLRLGNGEYEVRAAGGGTLVRGGAAALERLQRSSAHYAQRPDRTYARFDPARTSMSGYSWSASVDRISGRHWLFGATAKVDSPGFSSNDIGFLMAADGIQPRVYVRYRETQPGPFFRSYALELRQSNEWNYGWNLQSAETLSSINATWRNFWTSAVSATVGRRGQSATLTRGGPLMQTPRDWRLSASVANSAASQTRWSGTAVAAGDEDGGMAQSGQATLSFRPGPRWELSVRPSYERATFTQQYVTTRGDGRAETYGSRYIFADIDRTTLSTQFRLNFTLKPDLTIDVYAEPFAASGRYHNLGELLLPGTRQRLTYGGSGTSLVRQGDGSLLVSANGPAFLVSNRDFNVRSFRSTMVLRYEWRPGSTFYAVWQQDRGSEDAGGGRVGVADLFESIAEPGRNVLLVKTSFWLPVW